MSVWFVFFMSISLFAGVCFAPDILGMPMGKGPDVFLQVLSVLCMLFFAGSLFLGAKAKKIYKQESRSENPENRRSLRFFVLSWALCEFIGVSAFILCALGLDPDSQSFPFFFLLAYASLVINAPFWVPNPQRVGLITDDIS